MSVNSQVLESQQVCSLTRGINLEIGFVFFFKEDNISPEFLERKYAHFYILYMCNETYLLQFISIEKYIYSSTFSQTTFP